jgi:hypothetical protein
MNISHQMRMMRKIWNVLVADMSIVNVRTKISSLEIILGAELVISVTRTCIVALVTTCIVTAHMVVPHMYVTDCADSLVITAQYAHLVCAINAVADQSQIQMMHFVADATRNMRIVCVMLKCIHTRMKMRRKRKKKMTIQV